MMVTIWKNINHHLLTHLCNKHTLLWSLAQRACPLGGAGTGVAVDAISAGSSILAGIARALVHVLIAILARPTRVTATDVAIGCILGRSRQKKKHAGCCILRSYKRLLEINTNLALAIYTRITSATNVADLSTTRRSITITHVTRRTGAWWDNTSWKETKN